jgi:hypothetical protein
MLQLVQSQIRHGGGFTVIVYRHHAAFVFKLVEGHLYPFAPNSLGSFFVLANCQLLPIASC